jgi:hypothetical protein
MIAEYMPECLPRWLATLDAEALAELMARRPDVLGIPPATLTELADRLGSRQSVEIATRGLNRTQVDVLAAAVGLPSITLDAIRARFLPDADPAVIEATTGELSGLGLLLPTSPGTFALVPALTVTGGRSSKLMRLHREPPAPRSTSVRGVDSAAGIIALTVVRGVAGLIELCSVSPLVTLRNGGVGVKEIRRVAQALRADEQSVRLWLPLAYHADLLDIDDGEIMPTRGADEWLAGSPADRLVPLLMTWWRLPAAPTAPDANGKAQTALSHPYHDDDRELRHDLIGWLGRQPPGTSVVDRGELLSTLAWAKPQVYRAMSTAGAVLDEAERLGVTMVGGLSAWGRALVSGSESALVEAVGKWLPEATDTVRLLPDLTAVVTGMPTAELSALLDLAAEAGEQDTASVWRFSASSVRRALDAGVPAGRLLDSLRAASDDDVPQALEYLVKDVERRHGELTVREVGCVISTDDHTLLTEVAAHRGLASLRLRVLAPGVVASNMPAGPTLDALRANGYVPSAVDVSGMPLLGRAQPRRARPRPRVTRRPPSRWPVIGTESPGDLLELAHELLAAPVDTTPGAGSLVRQYGRHLSDQEITLLTDAIERESAVEITYRDQNERTSRRVITPLDLAGGIVEAWCHLRDDERHFLISGIQQVDTPQS